MRNYFSLFCAVQCFKTLMISISAHPPPTFETPEIVEIRLTLSGNEHTQELIELFVRSSPSNILKMFCKF